MSSMFLHYLFLMLVAIHVTLACQCKPMTLLQAMCSKNTTVVLARVSDGQPHQVGKIPYRRYDIDVERKLLTQATQKLTLNNNHGTLQFPERESDCGGIFRDGIDYVIAGYADSNGQLVTSHCYHYVEYELLITDTYSMSIIIGEGDCDNA
ncbi:hypothetical protein ACJMK2_034938 [Sinanodonta woodiana]|uniref:Uncharacterized protein n=1 Tax=Sinanodonta woodiana TaxID=1069815 RepID=A0ABD3WXA3_SINWO